MSLPFIILLVGLAYVLLLGGMALLRREGLSTRFAIESACITALSSGMVALTAIQINPVLFLILLYLLTMRVRILVDLANVLARQGKYSHADNIYNFTSRLWPDPTGKLILKVNQATLLLQENKLDESISMFTDILNQVDQGYLGVKYEAAAHFNLGVAYLRKNFISKATIEFNAVIDTWPASLYAHRAQEALDRHRSKDSGAIENEQADH